MGNIYITPSVRCVHVNYIQSKCFMNLVLIYQPLSDLALRSLHGSDKMEEEKGVCVAGILMALCCHHRCDWGSYTGKDFMLVCALQLKMGHHCCSTIAAITTNILKIIRHISFTVKHVTLSQSYHNGMFSQLSFVARQNLTLLSIRYF
jgi:hypothetical protein